MQPGGYVRQCMALSIENFATRWLSGRLASVTDMDLLQPAHCVKGTAQHSYLFVLISTASSRFSTQDYIQLPVRRMLEQHPRQSQRTIAHELGINLCNINLCLQA